APGVYVVALTPDSNSTQPTQSDCPISVPAIEEWLEVRPELRLDGKRPSATRLAERISRFWLPDEVILYIRLAGTSIRAPVRQYYATRLGARRPHAGGHFLKVLSNLDDLFVHWAPGAEVRRAEAAMLGRFCGAVSEPTRNLLLDPERP